jgi:uncharacterized protein YecE (DUF72 family)
MKSSTSPLASPFYVGCAIWGFKGWVGNFFPEKTKAADFLREYSHRLTTVEGNTTFYAVPSPEIIQRWVEQTPPGFKFCPKFPQEITHGKRLKDALPDTLDFLERMSGLGDRLGPSFIQLPPSFSPGAYPVLASFLDAIPQIFRVGVEVRHPGWFTAEGRKRLNTLLEEHRAAKVIIDTRGLREGESGDVLVNRSRERKPDLPIQPDRTTDFVFVRLITNPNADLNEPYFAEWTDRIAGWIKAGVTVYLFCHCPVDEHSPVYAREMHARISAQVPIPPLPAEARQGMLL